MTSIIARFYMRLPWEEEPRGLPQIFLPDQGAAGANRTAPASADFRPMSQHLPAH